MGYPPHAGNRKRKKADIQQDKSLAKKKAKRQEKEFLKNLQLYRAYWWHVLIRTMLEVNNRVIKRIFSETKLNVQS